MMKFLRKEFKKKHAVLAVLLILFFSGFFLRLLPVRDYHFWDECVYLLHSEKFYSGYAPYEELDYRPPMLSLFIALAYFIWHNSAMAHIVVALLSSLGIIFIYLLGKELYDERVGLIAAVSLAFLPFVVELSHQVLTGVPGLSLGILSIFFLSKKKRNYAIASGFFMALSVLTRFTYLILLPLPFLFYFFKKIEKEQLLMAIFAFAVTMVPYLLWAKLSFGFELYPFIAATGAVTSEAVNDPFFYFKAAFEVLGLVTAVGVVLFFARKKFNKVDAMLLLWVLFFIGYMTLIPHKETRYALPLAAPILLMSARGFSLFISKNRRGLGVLAVLCVTMLYSIYPTFVAFNPKWLHHHAGTFESLNVAQYIGENMPEGFVIYANYNYPVLAYYSNRKTIDLWPQYEDFYDEFPDNMPYPGWFVYYKTVKKQPNATFMNSSKHFKMVKDFKEISIYEYIP